ncbi:acyl-CoA dehydrogenase [Rhodoglobus vestalii]|uniref:Acyl-[acyl-carrier-protein] dehydrogenase MbtN n=1 Tax=Rhodoglobus vestalii TaxID=193384 RepID=A0A8H2PXA7_9MICO|nr:acyl-CoA dehydrogenase family protein [Rhodoglobus vestalii]TQO20050.1 acyl-CoA dehydrogenase [Rhodoglobus vestalii]
MKRDLYTPEQESFRATVADFISRAVVPELSRWESQGYVDPEFFLRAAEQGLLGSDPRISADFRFSSILYEELVAVGATGVAMAMGGFNDLVEPYISRFATTEQKLRWLPRLRAGKQLAALAITESAAGSDLRGIRTVADRDGDSFIVNGSKTLIGSAGIAGVFIVLVATSPGEFSLLVIDKDAPGIVRGPSLAKIGLHSQQMGSLEFVDARVPVSNLLGEEGKALDYLRTNLPQERLVVALMATASSERMLRLALDQARSRTIAGRPVGEYQANLFMLAELATQVEAGRAFIDRCILGFVNDELSAVEAAMAKLWATEAQQDIATRSLQIHGGAGYLADHPATREFLDARASTIYAGTSEVMKHIVGRDLLRDY